MWKRGNAYESRLKEDRGSISPKGEGAIIKVERDS